MKEFMTLHIAMVLVGTVVLGLLRDFDQAMAFLSGGALMTANVFLLGFAWKNILAKKLIALSIGVIVIKYAFLGVIIYSVITFHLMSVGWFTIGMGVLLISSVAYAVLSEMLNRNKEATSGTF